MSIFSQKNSLPKIYKHFKNEKTETVLEEALMKDLDQEGADPLRFNEEKLFHVSQTGSLNDPSLNQLRDQIKKVTIPLLIKIFQLKLELNQAISFPSRLQSQKSKRSLDEIVEQLNLLDKDLKVLLLWCQNCRSQISKALSPPEEDLPTAVTPNADSHPAVSKSFSDALLAQYARSAPNSTLRAEESHPDEPIFSLGKGRWWQKLFKN